MMIDPVCVCGHKESQHWKATTFYRHHTPCAITKCRCINFRNTWRI